MLPDQDRSYCAPVKVTPHSPSRTPSIGLTPPRQRSGSLMHNLFTVRLWPEHHLRFSQPFALSGLWIAAVSYSKPPSTLDAPLAPRRRCLSPISATNLLSTNTRWILNSQAWGLRLTAPRDLFFVRSRATANIDEKPSTTTPDSRFRHFRPWVATPFGGVSLAVTAFTVLFRLFGYPNETRVGLLNVREFSETATNTPCSTLDSLGLTRVRLRTRTFSTSHPPRQLVFEVQSVFRR